VRSTLLLLLPSSGTIGANAQSAGTATERKPSVGSATVSFVRYVRYESQVSGPGGRHTGIFGLANGLARAGALKER
jgi:hypothetical protein